MIPLINNTITTTIADDDDLTFDQTDIDKLWNKINRSDTKSLSTYITLFNIIFSCIGSLSNFMSVIVLLKLSFNLSTFVYLTGLTVSDMITCFSIIMTQLDPLFTSTFLKPLPLSKYIEFFFGAVAAGSRVLSLWISAAVTCDRWILICYPVMGKRLCTVTRARLVIKILFLSAFIYIIPLIFEYKIHYVSVFNFTQQYNNSTNQPEHLIITKKFTKMATTKAYRWTYMFFNAIFVYTVPTVTIITFNLQLIRALHKLKVRAKKLRKTRQQSSYHVTIMVIAMVFALLFCRIPTIVLWGLWSFESSITLFFDKNSQSFARTFHELVNLIALINAATNFIPFCIFGTIFRKKCINVYCCCCRRFKDEDDVQQQLQRKKVLNRSKQTNSQNEIQMHSTMTMTITSDSRMGQNSTKFISVKYDHGLDSPLLG
ncbi:unnamed protein product [Didymodactylos carnosus]|uniref:G-protein coupled receptors family 1 profile domain-containing protein n=1 Tax=Didymodactylos carnosus TaxID=1234261 RepID=A0A813RP17_9BILA|nr:unnamed protein product [Didymodactylos carnosus]CAF1041189.1 unnamed protein product [Didymodactylos carnosus]CAF3567095.1 unnamed protein product [Didymodactylos carnosus]CAF3809382.1 unnamed protein product [Didymodactylos carnosus]